MPQFISPNFTAEQFPGGPQTLEEKLLVFTDRVRGWQLAIAEQVSVEIPHSGFGVLSIITSYFEMIGMYVHGPNQTKQVPAQGGAHTQKAWGSRDYFEAGVNAVFPQLANANAQHVRWFMKAFYKNVRCGLYHQGATRSRIFLTGEIPDAVRFDDLGPDGHRVVINPRALVEHLKAHFSSYVLQTSNPANQAARQTFEAMYDFEQAQ